MRYDIPYTSRASLFITALIAMTLILGSCSSPSGSDSGEEEQEGENGEEQTLFSGGSGTMDDPYQIETLAQLDSVRYYLDQHFIQIADINASETANWNDAKGFNPIGENKNNPFVGSYDGNGYSINELFIDRPNTNGVGLFASVKNTSSSIDSIKIESVALKKVSIEGNDFVGGIYGRNITDELKGSEKGIVEISNSKVTGGVSGNNVVGCLAGHAVWISNSNSNCTVVGNSTIGGLAGSVYSISEDRKADARVENSYAQGNVEAKGSFNSVGGAIGFFAIGEIRDSYAKGKVIAPIKMVTTIGENSSVGGFLGGLKGGVIYSSYAEGDVSGTLSVGGFVGSADKNCCIDYETKIVNSSSSGDVSGTSYVGGFVGNFDEAQILDSKATGNVSINPNNYNGGFDGLMGGGFVGILNKGSIVKSFAGGNIEGKGENLGGFAGRSSQGKIAKSFATGNIDGKITVGGFVGKARGGEITKSFADGDVEGESSVGGFAGAIVIENGKVTNSYALGSVSGEGRVGGFTGSISADPNGQANGSVIKVYSSGQVSISDFDGGGFCGIVFYEPKIEYAFWDTEMSGQSNGIGRGSVSGNVIGLSTSEMMGSSAENNMSSFDFSQIWKITDSYPELQWQEN